MFLGSDGIGMDEMVDQVQNPTSDQCVEVPMSRGQNPYGPQRRDHSNSRSRPFRGDVPGFPGSSNSFDPQSRVSGQNPKYGSDETSALAKTDVHVDFGRG
eukprot:10160663-Alexandrium_andersonii.AAC.1